MIELLGTRYWRDADLTGLQLTSNRLSDPEMRPHRHVGYTLAVCDVELHVRTTGNRITVVPPGTLLRIAPQVWHAVQARSAPWREDAMYCSPAVARCISAAHESTPLARAQDDAGVAVFLDASEAHDFLECHRLLSRPTGLGRDDDTEESAAGRALLRQRLARWIPLAAQPARIVDSGEDRMNRLYELIASGFQQRMTLDSLAEAAGLHPVHLQRRFKGAFGFTPHEMLVGHRIEYARDLIAGGARVTYAAHAAGFTDHSHLHKTFLGTYAVLPGDYRRLSALDALQPASARNGISG